MATLTEMQKEFWEKYYYKWEFYEEEVRQQIDLANDIKTRVLTSIQEIKKIFDEDWMKINLSKHLIFSRLADMRLDSRLWLERFGIDLKLLSNCPNFKEVLIPRLKTPTEYLGAEIELTIAAKLKRSGLSVGFISNKSKDKVPDLRVYLSGKPIYFEITTLRTPEESVKAAELANTFSSLFFTDQSVLMTFRIHKLLSKPRIQELLAEIKSTIEKVKREGQPSEIKKTNIVDCFICPVTMREKYIEWCKQNSIVASFEGPPLNLTEKDDIRRIKRTIKKKIQQLPLDNQGVIIIYADNFAYWQRKLEFYNDLVNELQETINDCPPNVSAIILVTSLFNPFIIPKTQEESMYILTRYLDEFSENFVLIIKNEFTSFPLQDEIKNALLVN